MKQRLLDSRKQLAEANLAIQQVQAVSIHLIMQHLKEKQKLEEELSSKTKERASMEHELELSALKLVDLEQRHKQELAEKEAKIKVFFNQHILR